jgi:hypothetical protein
MEGVRRIWAVPTGLAVATALGLTAALIGDGWADLLSWASLAVPAIVMIRFALKRG